MTKVRTYLIPSWSGRVYKARKNYCCDLCGGIIPRGVSYVRDVVRDGPDWGKDPLRNIHKHHRCEAPWWQPGDMPKRLRHVGRLPHRSPDGEADIVVPLFSPSIWIEGAGIGTLTWQLPQPLAKRLALCPDTAVRTAALGEFEQAISLMLKALVESSSSGRKANELGHELNSIALFIERNTPARP